jgi:hypothetical protein
MIRYKLFNNILGWVSFVIALVVYSLTLEQNVPLWDCGEFISASYSLQVVHPPGAPLFLLLGRLFIVLFGGLTNGAVAVNFLSAVASAGTVALTFWIVTHLGLKLKGKNLKNPKISAGEAVGIFGAGLVGALALTFSDTFWFSAVEAEVYAASSLFTMISFWGILKWEAVKNEKGGDRWLVFIFYTIGLAIGLHLLNLLVIPAVILYYFFNRYEINLRNTIIALGIGIGALGFLNFATIPGIPHIAAKVDLIFVNNFGLPYNSGLIFTVLLIITLIVLAIRFTIQKNWPILNLIVVCYAFVLIGYGSYAMIPIRAAAQPPINMNEPEDIYSLLSYIQRDQYGDRPLFKGPHYVVTPNMNIPDPTISNKYRPEDQKFGRKLFRAGEDGYEEIGQKTSYVWPERVTTVFPRMAALGDKWQGYKYWYDERKRTVEVGGQKYPEYRVPSMDDNLGFFVDYQLGWMYMRYFMWNFAGRQSDIQNVTGDINDGNWLSGIELFDAPRLGPQSNLPESLKTNKGRNTYYLLPLLFGLIGLFYQSYKQKYDAIVMGVLFVFTGIMIILYLNQPPLEPRERDYGSVGSFQTFCVWIGLSVLAIQSLLAKLKLPSGVGGGIATVLALLSAPYLMGSQNWDDHDRSGRELGISFAKNYLNSCEQNAILFTNGDNDTYPLWYAQNVEGIRTDVRIINLSLLSTEWYAEALTRKYYASDPLPMSIKPSEKLKDGERESFSYRPDQMGYKRNGYYKLSDVLNDMVSDDKNKQVQIRTREGVEFVNYMPAKNFYIPVDKEAAIASGTVSEADTARIVDNIQFKLPENNMYKGTLVMLDIIATNAERGWERPIYFTTTTGKSTYKNLEDYFRHEGLTFRLVPIRSEWDQTKGIIDRDLLYKRLMEDYTWGGMEKNMEIYLDDKASLVPKNLTVLFAQLAGSYISQGDTVKAKALMDKSLTVIPHPLLPMNPALRSYYTELYKRIGETEKAKELLALNIKEIAEQAEYYTQNYGKVSRDLKAEFRVKLIGYSNQPAGLFVEVDNAERLAKELGNPEGEQRMKELKETIKAVVGRL